MALYQRLMHLEDPAIGVHGFMAALGEYERGRWTLAEVVAAFSLTPAEQIEVTTLAGKLIGVSDSLSLGGYTVLSNIGTSYDAIEASKGLGAAMLEIGGIEWFRFGVFVNKIGSGTQSWQLWNETDGVEAAVIDDAGAAGDKQLSVTIIPTTPYAPGLKVIRVRAKSAVGTDDPVYYGGSVLFRRRARLTTTELHEVLLLAQQQTPPLSTVAALKARLGV